MAKRKPARRESTLDDWLRDADRFEADGNKERADLIRKLAKDRFRAVMCYGMNRSFARLLADGEILAEPPPKPYPWLKD